ncbi:MAG TPA: hypothetical protein VFS43_44210 [Polyangiaceae bacterium]|nr:hypothetical protein [Polyangiaceae bacterium]
MRPAARALRAALAPLAALVATAPAPRARGDEGGAAACNAAYTEVQRLRKATKLRAARGRALACAQDVCTETVRTDCGRWLDEIERATPSILVDARDAAGNELAEVRVRAGEETLAERLDGRQIVLDPGEYLLRFEHRGRALERRTIAREGEKYRVLQVRFPPERGVSAGGPAPPDAAPAGGSKPLPLGTYVLGGVGAAGLVTFGALSLSGYLSETKLRDTCGPTDTCSRSDVDSIRTRYLVGDVALGVGLLSTAGAFALWALSPAPPRAGASAGLRLVPLGAGAALIGGF